MFWPFTVWINCSSFSRSLDQFFLTVGQNNFGNKIPFPLDSYMVSCPIWSKNLGRYLVGKYTVFIQDNSNWVPTEEQPWSSIWWLLLWWHSYINPEKEKDDRNVIKCPSGVPWKKGCPAAQWGEFLSEIAFFDCLLVLTDDRSRFYKHLLRGIKLRWQKCF